ncbi:MAG: DNA translocase FtsK 4TM domain-containing protein, partial [Candidatus Eisenbacteria bacterium]
MAERKSRTPSFIAGTVLFVFGVMLLASLVSYQQEDAGLLREGEGNVANAFGTLGARVAHWTFSIFGVIVPWPVGAVILAWSWNRF